MVHDKKGKEKERKGKRRKGRGTADLTCGTTNIWPRVGWDITWGWTPLEFMKKNVVLNLNAVLSGFFLSPC